MTRLGQVGDAISQLLNVLLLPNPSDTDANESISGRCYRRGWWRAQYLIDAIAGRDHCYRAHMKDVERARKLLHG